MLVCTYINKHYVHNVCAKFWDEKAMGCKVINDASKKNKKQWFIKKFVIFLTFEFALIFK